MPLPNADPDKRMYKLLKNIDLENLSFAQFQSTAETVFAEPEAEDTLRRIVLINLARMSVAGDWNGLTTSGGGEDTVLFVPFSPPEATGDASFLTTCPTATGYGSSFTLDSNFYTPSHYPFYSGDYTTVEELAFFFTGTAGDAGSTGSLAIYTLSTSSDTGWAVGRPMAMVANSEVSYATDTSDRVEFSPASTVTLTPKTWYSIAIVADDAYTQFPTIYRAKEINQFWGDGSFAGLKATGESNYTLPASYTTSTAWAQAQTTYYVPKLWWRGTN